MNARTHWSYSALSQYLRCPLQFYFKRILGLKQPFTPSGLALGSSVHEALAHYHRGLQRNELPSIEVVRQVFTDSWQTRKTHEVIAIEEAKPESEILDQGVALLEAYLKEPPPENVLAVEFELLAPIHNSEGEYLEKPMMAVMDLITRPGDELKITDLKTSGRSYSAMETDLALQATCYVNVAHEIFGQIPEFEYAVLVKTKKPRVQRITTVRNELDLGRLGDLIQTVDRAIESNVFYPIESPINCSGCSFRKHCREWTGSTNPQREEARISLDQIQTKEGEPCEAA